MTEADYAACREHVVRSLRSLRPSFPHDCEDAVQKAFVVLLSQREPETGEPFVDGLARVASKLLYAAAGKGYRSKERLCGDIADERPSPALGPEEALLARERAALMDRLLAELPPKSGEALRLALEGREAPDIAMRLGVPVEVVHSRLQYARKETRRVLQGWVKRKKMEPGEFLLLALWLGLLSEQSAHALPPPAPIAAPTRLPPRQKAPGQAVLAAASLAAGLLLAASLGDSTPRAITITTDAARFPAAAAPASTGLGEAPAFAPAGLSSIGTSSIESAEPAPLRPLPSLRPPRPFHPLPPLRPASGGAKPAATGGANGAGEPQPPEWILASEILQSARGQQKAEAARAAALFAKARPNSPHTGRLDATLRRGEAIGSLSHAP